MTQVMENSAEKAISFSEKQLGIIKQMVFLEGGQDWEFDYFVEVCELYGLNPILKQIIFQKRNTNRGPRVSFITTRDGYLSAARSSPFYVGAPLAGVVHEGDEFAFDNVTGMPIHRFGKQRGNILGAWAVMKHKTFHPVPTFVNFAEYFKANESNDVVRKYPSAMIQKVAEVFVLRRQFPLTGVTTFEELGLGEQDVDSITEIQAEKERNGQVFQPGPQLESVASGTHQEGRIEVSASANAAHSEHATAEQEKQGDNRGSEQKASGVQQPVETNRQSQQRTSAQEANKAAGRRKAADTAQDAPAASTAATEGTTKPAAATATSSNIGSSKDTTPLINERFKIVSRQSGETGKKTIFWRLQLLRSNGQEIYALVRDPAAIANLEQIADGEVADIVIQKEDAFSFVMEIQKVHAA